MSYKRKGFKDDDVRLRRTRVVSTRMDDITLARILMAFDEKEIVITSLSELVYLSCLALGSMSGVTDQTQDLTSSEARRFLSDRLGIPLDPPGQSNTAYVKQMQSEQAWKREGEVRALPKINARKPKDYHEYAQSSSYNRDWEPTIDDVRQAEAMAKKKLKEEDNYKEQAKQAQRQAMDSLLSDEGITDSEADINERAKGRQNREKAEKEEMIRLVLAAQKGEG